MSVDEIVRECAEVERLGIGGVILFGLPESKDELASGAYDDNGIVQRAIRAIKAEVKNLLVITTSATASTPATAIAGLSKTAMWTTTPLLQWLAKSALSHARAGADIVAPSDMMDGRVAAIRQALDADSFERFRSWPYSAKFASVFYGPFREAAESTPQFGDRRSYQMDPATHGRRCGRLNSTWKKART
jgi:porphobilinogen synthase